MAGLRTSTGCPRTRRQRRSRRTGSPGRSARRSGSPHALGSVSAAGWRPPRRNGHGSSRIAVLAEDGSTRGSRRPATPERQPAQARRSADRRRSPAPASAGRRPQDSLPARRCGRSLKTVTSDADGGERAGRGLVGWERASTSRRGRLTKSSSPARCGPGNGVPGGLRGSRPERDGEHEGAQDSHP